jgi:hypothetical protein
VSERSFRRERARETRREQRRRRLRARKATGAGALIGVTALLAPAAADATTFTVDNTSDTTTAGDCDPGIADDCSLRQAVDDANANSGPDIVALSTISGTIRLTQGQVNVTGDTDIQGPGADTLTISGDANDDGVHDLAYYGSGNGGSTPKSGDSRIFQFGTSAGTPAGVTASVSGLTISGGTSGVTSKYSTIGGPHNKYSGNSGGAIVAYDSAVTISHVTMTDNQSTSGGAAVAGLTAGVPTANSLTIADSDLNGNEAYAGGGGVYVGGPVGDLTVTGSSISGNQTDGKESTTGGTTFKYSTTTGIAGTGGGIQAQVPGGATISGSTISNNTAADHALPSPATNNASGGGLFLAGSGASPFQITDTTITGNSGILRGGGAFIGDGHATISASTISENTLASGTNSDAQGGGLMFAGDLQLSGSTVSGNSVIATTANQGTGGGLYWHAGQRDDALGVENSTISGNQSSGAGAGA